MTVERADLSVSSAVSLERMAPVAEAPAVQGQSSRENGEGKPRRRPPPEKEASVEPSSEPEEAAEDPPVHRIDSLA
jgi:hypothetical protein